MSKRKRPNILEFTYNKRQKFNLKTNEFQEMIQDLGIGISIVNELEFTIYKVIIPIEENEEPVTKEICNFILNNKKKIHQNLYNIEYYYKNSAGIYVLHFLTPKDRFSKVLNDLIPKSIYISFIPMVIEKISSLRKKVIYNMSNKQLLESFEEFKIS